MKRVRHKTLFHVVPGELTIVFGNAGSGKSTAIMVDALCSAANRKRIYFKSYETPKNVLDKFFSNYSYKWKDYIYPFDNFVVDDDCGAQFIQFLLKITDSDADIIYIDYLGLIKFKNNDNDKEFVLKELEKCARITNKAIVLVDQIGKEPYEEKDLYEILKNYQKILNPNWDHNIYAIKSNSNKKILSTIYQCKENEFQIIKKNFKASEIREINQEITSNEIIESNYKEIKIEISSGLPGQFKFCEYIVDLIDGTRTKIQRKVKDGKKVILEQRHYDDIDITTECLSYIFDILLYQKMSNDINEEISPMIGDGMIISIIGKRSIISVPGSMMDFAVMKRTWKFLEEIKMI